MKILMLTTQNVGIAWWRFQLPARALRRAGHEVTVFEEADYRRVAEEYGHLWGYLDQCCDDYDIIHSGYSTVEEHVQVLCAIRNKEGKHFLTDIDDDLNSVPTYNPGFKTFGPASPERKVALLQLRVSDAVTFSTEPLKTSLSPIVQRSFVLPNLVDPDTWDYPVDPKRAEDKTIRILLAGGQGRYGDWQHLKEPLEHLVGKYDGKEGRPKVHLFFMGCTPDWVAPWLSDPKNPHQNRATYIRPTASVPLFQRALRWIAPDIYLSPLEPNTFNRSKSNLKAMEAALCGASFVCTDWETYQDVPSGAALKVENTYTQWYESLSALVEDEGLRKSMNQKGLEWTMDTMVIDKYIDRWVDAYSNVLSRPPINRLEDIRRLT